MLSAENSRLISACWFGLVIGIPVLTRKIGLFIHSSVMIRVDTAVCLKAVCRDAIKRKTSKEIRCNRFFSKSVLTYTPLSWQIMKSNIDGDWRVTGFCRDYSSVSRITQPMPVFITIRFWYTVTVFGHFHDSTAR